MRYAEGGHWFEKDRCQVSVFLQYAFEGSYMPVNRSRKVANAFSYFTQWLEYCFHKALVIGSTPIQ